MPTFLNKVLSSCLFQYQHNIKSFKQSLILSRYYSNTTNKERSNNEVKESESTYKPVWKARFCYAKSLCHADCLKTIDPLFFHCSLCFSMPNIFGVTHMFSSVAYKVSQNKCTPFVWLLWRRCRFNDLGFCIVA